MCFLMPLGYEFLRFSSCWMVFTVWRALVRYCIECPSISVCLKIFFMIYQGYVFGERKPQTWSGFSILMTLMITQHQHAFTVDVNLDHLAVVAHDTFLHCRVTLPLTPLPILHSVLLGRKILHAAHTKKWEFIS